MAKIINETVASQVKKHVDKQVAVIKEKMI
jgi:hypothetical protein